MKIYFYYNQKKKSTKNYLNDIENEIEIIKDYVCYHQQVYD